MDAARGLALLGMMAAHVVTIEYGAEAPLVREIVSGRSAALFAVLAGVGIALASGGAVPRTGAELWRARRGLVARAFVIAVIGLTVSAVDTRILVILPYYGVLFLLALPVLGWGARRLVVLAVGAAVVAPVVSHVVRGSLDLGAVGDVTWRTLARDPWESLLGLAVTGTYPVLTWSAYLFAGLAIGRLPLGRLVTAWWLVLTGTGLAVVGWLVGQWALRLVGRDVVAAAFPGEAVPVEYVEALMLGSFHGSPPADAWWWLGIQTPHTGTTPDLVHTTGTAMLVLGLCLLVVPRVGRLVHPLVAVGSATLTLYTAHVLVMGGSRHGCQASHRLSHDPRRSCG